MQLRQFTDSENDSRKTTAVQGCDDDERRWRPKSPGILLESSFVPHGWPRVRIAPHRASAGAQVSLGGEKKAPRTRPRLTSVRIRSRTRGSVTLPARPRRGSKSRTAKPCYHVLFFTPPDPPQVCAKCWPLSAPEPLASEDWSFGRGQNPQLALRSVGAPFFARPSASGRAFRSYFIARAA